MVALHSLFWGLVGSPTPLRFFFFTRWCYCLPVAFAAFLAVCCEAKVWTSGAAVCYEVDDIIWTCAAVCCRSRFFCGTAGVHCAAGLSGSSPLGHQPLVFTSMWTAALSGDHARESACCLCSTQLFRNAFFVYRSCLSVDLIFDISVGQLALRMPCP